MKHSGRARKVGLKLIMLSLVAVAVVWAIGFLVMVMGISLMVITPGLVVIWVLFAGFTLFFFRDPSPRVPSGANLVVCPAHAKIDIIDTTVEPEFMGGECQRISMFLSVFDVHVQYAPVSGTVAMAKYTMGQFVSALRTESAATNENVLLGFVASEPRGQNIGVRLIAGAIARRIVTFSQPGDEVARGERISLIQFGSRADVYLPASAKIKVKLGERVVGGETVLAAFE
ncbi:MAG: phosphatidylserine decarboxylase [Limisphaerales bacterium]|jgi:phosphatidylserine decarboxylase